MIVNVDMTNIELVDRSEVNKKLNYRNVVFKRLYNAVTWKSSFQIVHYLTGGKQLTKKYRKNVTHIKTEEADRNVIYFTLIGNSSINEDLTQHESCNI